jgi:hypothetical protein
MLQEKWKLSILRYEGILCGKVHMLAVPAFKLQWTEMHRPIAAFSNNRYHYKCFYVVSHRHGT